MTTVYFPVQLVITGIITVGLAIATGGASIAAELEVTMAAAGIALSAASAVGSIRGVLTANEMKQAAQTTHEAKKAAKFILNSEETEIEGLSEAGVRITAKYPESTFPLEVQMEVRDIKEESLLEEMKEKAL